MQRQLKRDIRNAIHSCDDRIRFLKRRRDTEWDKRNFQRQIYLEELKKKALFAWIESLERERRDAP